MGLRTYVRGHWAWARAQPQKARWPGPWPTSFWGLGPGSGPMADDVGPMSYGLLLSCGPVLCPMAIWSCATIRLLPVSAGASHPLDNVVRFISYCHIDKHPGNTFVRDKLAVPFPSSSSCFCCRKTDIFEGASLLRDKSSPCLASS